jgi:O-antigen ligase
LFNSARERVALWGYTAQHSNERIMVGAGAYTTPELNKAMDAAGRGIDVRYTAIRPGRHSHNYYLQVWYELGVVGALLFLAIGLTILNAIARQGVAVQRLAVTQFAMVATMIATSYGLWQLWLHCAIAVSIILMVVAMRLGSRHPDEPGHPAR